jgi:hypothetical protein
MLFGLLMSIAVTAGTPHDGSVPSSRLMNAAREYIARRSAADMRMNAVHGGIPSFARQTGLACSACHTAFPQLTALGRTFKLNGYTLSGAQVITAGDSGQRLSLKLGLIPPVSAMVVTSLSHTATTPPGTQNSEAQFPQELSLFVGGEITPQIGTFLQLTYSGIDGAIGIDNAEVRFADHTQLGQKDLLYGLTLNNNPTNQDVWNSAPAWRFPFTGSEVAPSPAAAPLLEGALAQQVAGLGAYAMWNNVLYAEYTAYRSAPQGGAHPLDATASNTIDGVASYWRAFLQHAWGDQTLMVGGFGLAAKLIPDGVTGPVNRYTDAGIDAQFERRLGGGMLTAHGSWLHERQQLDAAFAADAASHPVNTLQALRLDAGVLTASRVGATVGYFSVSGTADALLYPAGDVSGSAGRPDSRGVIGELSYMPWLNTRLGAQYVAYNRFNGAATNYDGAGRNASANNTLFLFAWLAF